MNIISEKIEFLTSSIFINNVFLKIRQFFFFLKVLESILFHSACLMADEYYK